MSSKNFGAIFGSPVNVAPNVTYGSPTSSSGTSYIPALTNPTNQSAAQAMTSAGSVFGNFDNELGTFNPSAVTFAQIPWANAAVMTQSAAYQFSNAAQNEALSYAYLAGNISQASVNQTLNSIQDVLGKIGMQNASSLDYVAHQVHGAGGGLLGLIGL